MITCTLRSVAVCLVMGLAASVPVLAQAWPTKTVIVVVPFGPGNALETIGRPVLEQLSLRLGQPFIVENRAGAGGSTGTAYVSRAAADGYTVLFHSSTLSINHSFHTNRPYDTLADFIPVVPLGLQPTLLVAAASKGINTARELIEAAKARPGAMNFASAGPGSTSHLAAERFRLAAGIDAKHVPFRAPADALTETLTGRLDFYFPPISVALPLVQDGKLVPLAVSTKSRSAALPNVPTSTELGLKDSAFEFWIGFFLPAKTPREIVVRLHAETQSVLDTPAMKERMRTFGYEPMKLSPEHFAAFFREDIEDLARSMKAAGITAN
ncbi:MAG TPA: tripartite tricarboxylate transporter substrate-binding protein [Hyphomicrobiaceae bacterium]|jgi:tripartite-type tricarboxylate transporter receptor subunit TctC|nr:tripartite tricarboxylate transporter substrate-binding protein [Hyphomicrobiaceae bacterium]